jgi:hypothetical protein
LVKEEASFPFLPSYFILLPFPILPHLDGISSGDIQTKAKSCRAEKSYQLPSKRFLQYGLAKTGGALEVGGHN